jgi:N-acetylmuramoyl-L-alanine amidase
VSREIVRMRNPYILCLQLTRLMVFFVLYSFLIASCTLTDAFAGSIYLQGEKDGGEGITIVLDPGHGGHDSGAIGPGGLKEKDIALSLAQAVEKRLSGHYNVLLTRTDDYWIDVEERAATANRNKANLFISIHTGGSFRHKASGLATFCWSGEKTKRVSHILGAAEEWGTESGSAEWERIQERYLSKSRTLAGRVHKELIGRLNINDRGCRAAPIYVIASADMPAILVEVGYVTNPAEEKQLGNQLFLGIIAEGLSKGITAFVQEEINKLRK